MRLVGLVAATLALAASAGATPPYSQLVKRYAYDASAPLGVREAGVTTAGGIAVHGLSYASPVRGRVPAYLVVPAGDGPFSIVLWAPGSAGTRDEFLSDALALARRGVAGFLFTPPILRPGGPYLTTCDARKDVAAVAQYVKEEAVQSWTRRGSATPASASAPTSGRSSPASRSVFALTRSSRVAGTTPSSPGPTARRGCPRRGWPLTAGQ